MKVLIFGVDGNLANRGGDISGTDPCQRTCGYPEDQAG